MVKYGYRLMRWFEKTECPIFNPYFNEEIFKEESRLLKEYYSSIYANKMKYAINEMRNIMFENELYKIDPLGNEEDLNNITFDELESIYKNMIENDLITISVIGDIDFDEVEQLIKTTFTFKDRLYEPTLIDTETKNINKITKVSKTIDVNQAKLVMGYRNGTHYLSEDYYKTLVFNVLFGASSESMLFKEIREEKGLVYFINSSYDPYKGVMFITAGINAKDYNDVLNTTELIINNIIEMNYSDDLLSTAKTIINNRLIESLDSKIKAHKEYGMEYPKLVQQFVQHYRSGGGTKLVIQNENNEVVPLAAVAAYQAVFGRRS